MTNVTDVTVLYISELHCFECMVLTNGTGGDTDLPYEAHCETKPKKSRKCAEGVYFIFIVLVD